MACLPDPPLVLNAVPVGQPRSQGFGLLLLCGGDALTQSNELFVGGWWRWSRPLDAQLGRRGRHGRRRVAGRFAKVNAQRIAVGV